MPRKAAKRARTSKPVERDWRSTLFVWRGELEIGGSPDTGPQISWRGAWLGTDDDAMPTDTALKASANTEPSMACRELYLLHAVEQN